MAEKINLAEIWRWRICYPKFSMDSPSLKIQHNFATSVNFWEKKLVGEQNKYFGGI